MIRKIVDEFFGQVTHLGGLFFYFLMVLLALALGEWLLCIALFASLVVVMVIGLGVKALFWKQRPKRQGYENFLEKIDASSFPSIHAARVFSLATIFFFYWDTLATTVFLGFFALAVSYSRVYLKKHYFVDVLAGLALGVLTGALAATIF